MSDFWPKNIRPDPVDDEAPLARHVSVGVLDHLQWLQTVAGKYESPIEQQMAAGLYSAFRDLLKANTKLIELQAVVGNYRADFKVGKVIVECDGREFHETAVQRAHDTKRNVWMIRRGYHVIRFSGAQINRSPLECAAKVRKLFDRVSGVVR